MRSPDDDLPSASDGLLYVAAVIALVRASRPSVSCSIQTGPYASDTASRVDEFNRRARNCFNFRAPTPSRSAPGKLPYEILLRRMSSSSNLKRTQYTKKALATEISRSRRTGETLCAFMADLDHFKCVNDDFGHEAGDELLMAFAEMLRRQTRATEIVARIGGEEFVVLMPHTDLEQGLAIAERIRGMTTAVRIDSMSRGVTASFGVAELAVAEDGSAFMRRVDRALYKPFAHHEAFYRKGIMGLAYEIVINSSPCISYLMEENTTTPQLGNILPFIAKGAGHGTCHLTSPKMKRRNKEHLLSRGFFPVCNSQLDG